MWTMSSRTAVIQMCIGKWKRKLKPLENLKFLVRFGRFFCRCESVSRNSVAEVHRGYCAGFWHTCVSLSPCSACAPTTSTTVPITGNPKQGPTAWRIYANVMQLFYNRNVMAAYIQVRFFRRAPNPEAVATLNPEP